MIADATIVECIAEATRQLDALRVRYPGRPAREFSLAITACEDAQMRATRGLAHVQGVFAPADLQLTPSNKETHTA